MKLLLRIVHFFLFALQVALLSVFVWKIADLPKHPVLYTLLVFAFLLAFAQRLLYRNPLENAFVLRVFSPIKLHRTKKYTYHLGTGIVLLLLSLGFHWIVDFRLATAATDVATVTYLLGLLIVTIGVWGISVKYYPSNKPDTLMLIGICFFLLIGLVIRLYHLTAVGLLPEDLLWISQAFEVLARSVRSPFLFIGDLPMNFPVYLVAFFYWITGNVALATRLPSVFLNALFLLSLFMLARELFGKRVAFITLAIAVFSLWDIHNSRLGWQNLSTNPFLITAMLLFFVRSLKHQSIWDMYLCGLVSAFALHSLYIPALTIGTIMLFYVGWVVWIIIAKRSDGIFQQLQLAVNYASVFFVALVLIGGPTLIKLTKYSNVLSRHEAFFNQNRTLATQSGSQASYYLNQFSFAFTTFGSSDDHYRSDGPWGISLSALLSIVYFIGFVAVFSAVPRAGALLLLLSWIGFFIPVVVLNISGSIWRLIVFEPFVFIFSACGIEWLAGTVSEIVPLPTKSWAHGGLLCILFLMIGIFVKGEFERFYYLRTNEEQNHVFQLCKEVTDRIAISKFTSLAVPDDWCGQTVLAAFSYRIPVLIYRSPSELLSLTMPKGTLVLATKDKNVPGTPSLQIQSSPYNLFAYEGRVEDNLARDVVDIYRK